MLRTIAFTIFLLFIIETAAFSDIVQMKNGSVIKGVIVSETEDSIKLKTSIAVFSLLKSDVEQIQHGTEGEGKVLIKKWEEEKRRLAEEAKKARQKIKAKTTVKGAKTSSASKSNKSSRTKKSRSSNPSYEHGIDSVRTDNYANRELKYYYYIPGTVLENKTNTYPLLLMIPWLSGQGDIFVSPECKKFAYDNKFVIISPTFIWDEENWDSKESYQYPKIWSGRALLKIVDEFKKKNNLRISKFYLFGFSAGAQFALRFSLWKPNLISACAAHGSGARIVPEKKVKVKYFVTCGKQDVSRIDLAREFCTSARKRKIDATFKEYNADHELTKAQIEDSLKFFKRVH